MALAEIELVPFSYVVEDASLMVTFWPADVDIVKPDAVTLSTVPEDPPAAGPDRALDPPPLAKWPDFADGAVAIVAAPVVAVVAAPEPVLAVALTMP